MRHTSEVMRRQMGIARPNFVPLTDWMRLGSGDAVHERLTRPRVEPEIGLRLKTALESVACDHTSAAKRWARASRPDRPT